jgi:transposase-like protein
MQSNRSALFRGRHFAEEIIVLCVRWYLRFFHETARLSQALPNGF